MHLVGPDYTHYEYYVYINYARFLYKDNAQFCQTATSFVICRSSKAERHDVPPASLCRSAQFTHFSRNPLILRLLVSSLIFSHLLISSFNFYGLTFRRKVLPTFRRMCMLCASAVQNVAATLLLTLTFSIIYSCTLETVYNLPD